MRFAGRYGPAQDLFLVMCSLFKPMHTLAGPLHFDFILLPYGYAYNREYLEAKAGDVLEFVEGEQRMVSMVVKIPIDVEADALCRIRYGMSIYVAKSMWKQDAMILGHGIQAVSDDECLLVVYENE